MGEPQVSGTTTHPVEVSLQPGVSRLGVVDLGRDEEETESVLKAQPIE